MRKVVLRYLEGLDKYAEEHEEEEGTVSNIYEFLYGELTQGAIRYGEFPLYLTVPLLFSKLPDKYRDFILDNLSRSEMIDLKETIEKIEFEDGEEFRADMNWEKLELLRILKIRLEHERDN